MPQGWRPSTSARGHAAALKRPAGSARLQLEITEGVLIENPLAAAKELRQLRAAGVKVSIDDFGTGYSSLNYLQRYEVDKLKIDQSFVAKLGTSKGADAIVSSTIHLARAFDMSVTAEGVETAEQRAILEGLGCDELQGFNLSRPLPFAGFVELHRRTEAAA